MRLGPSSIIAHLVFIMAFTIECASATPADQFQLIGVGDDCLGSITVFNKVLTKNQMRTGERPNSTFEFITDYCDTDRIRAGVFGMQRTLTRASTKFPLGRGAPYSDGELSIDVRQGKSRLKVVHPPPAACNDGFLESLEFFDATVFIRNEKALVEIRSTLMESGCTKVSDVKTRKSLKKIRMQ